MKYSADYRKIAREKLDDRWVVSALTFLVYSIITALLAAIPVIGTISALIVTGPATVGLTIYFIKVHHSKKGEKIEDIREGIITLEAQGNTVFATLAAVKDCGN